MYVNTEAAQGTSYDEMVELPAEGDRDHAPAIPTSRPFSPAWAAASFGGISGSNQGRMYVQLKPRAQRKLSVSAGDRGAASEDRELFPACACS